jgi:hypothetical protein
MSADAVRRTSGEAATSGRKGLMGEAETSGASLLAERMRCGAGTEPVVIGSAPDGKGLLKGPSENRVSSLLHPAATPARRRIVVSFASFLASGNATDSYIVNDPIRNTFGFSVNDMFGLSVRFQRGKVASKKCNLCLALAALLARNAYAGGRQNRCAMFFYGKLT